MKYKTIFITILLLILISLYISSSFNINLQHFESDITTLNPYDIPIIVICWNNLTFIKSSEFNRSNYEEYVEVPLQQAHSLVSQADDCMQAKYMLLEADPELWRTLSFTRNIEKENQLKQHLNINPDDKFIFVNNNFAGPEFNYKADINLKTDLRIVHQEYIEGFTLLDWCGVLEQADEIHTVSTSLFFVIEALKLEKTLLHLYPRKP
jgi:hypothetical protein